MTCGRGNAPIGKLDLQPRAGRDIGGRVQGMTGVIAHQRKTALVPFLLEGIALTPELLQGDDIHPNKEGQPILLNNVWPVLKPMLKK